MSNKAKGSLAREIALVGVMAALSNILGFLAIPGPLNIQFGLTSIPILVVAFTLGPQWGALCGLLGGIVQAQKYGHILYIIYTAIQGFVAGYFAFRPKLTRLFAPLFGFVGGFFLIFWVDLLRTSKFTLDHLGNTSFTDAPDVFGMSIWMPIPIAATIGGIIVASLVLVIVTLRKDFSRDSMTHLAIAGCFGAVAYILYDMWVLYWVQGYPWIPTWFVLSKDLVQDFIGAVLCATILQHKRLRSLLASGVPAEAG